MWCIMVINERFEVEVEQGMSEKEETEGSYPLKSLHEFLDELDREWGKFRTAALIGIVTSGVLIFFLVFRFLSILIRIRVGDVRFLEVLDEFIFLVLVLAFVVYEIVLLLRQYGFFAKWERRVGLLLHLEERLMEGKTEKSEGTKDSASPQPDETHT